jgi:DNA-binding NtrC family response regulator
VLADGNILKPEHFPGLLDERPDARSTEMEFSGVIPLQQLERHYLEWAAAHFPGDRQSLAAKLGVSERTLYRKLQDASDD